MTRGSTWRRRCAAWLVLPAAWAAAEPAPDPARGEQIYARCQGCHAPAHDGAGPRHCGLFGRRAGAVAGYAYSAPMKRSRLVWDGPTLDRFLAAPTVVLPGTFMTYDGVKDAAERRDLIAYLQQLDHGPACPRRPAG